MKEMKPTETNPNDTALPPIIPPAVNSPEVEKTGEVSLQEEKVEIPSPEIATEVVSPQIASEVSPEEVATPVESETNK